ncbi:MAG: hypothetical protein ACTS6J_12140 [Burkholderiales bacterium]
MSAHTPDYIMRFMEAVFPSSPHLALASFNEQHALETATVEINTLRQQRDELVAALSALADLARNQPRPSGEHALCRTLLDIEGIARAAIDKARA